MVAAVAALAVALMIGVAVSAPLERPTQSASLGPWNAPVDVIADRSYLVDSWQEMLYADRWGNLVVSADEGATWDSPISVYGTFDVDQYVLYRANFSEYPSNDVFFSRSFDNGTTWTDLTYVMTHDGGTDGAYRLCKFGPTLIFYAYVHAGGEGWINCSRSMDGGLTWRPQAYVDDYVHVEDPNPADIVMCQGKLFLAYSHYNLDPIEFYDVVVIESDDMGGTWTNRQVVGSGWLPEIKEDSGNLYVTYLNYTTYDRVMFTMSSDAGATWTTPFEVGQARAPTDAMFHHALAASGSQIFVSYLDIDPSGVLQHRLRINCSVDGGSSWNDMGEVTGVDSNTCWPSLLTANGKLHFVFVDIGDPTGAWTTTYYRWLWLDEPIPEFGIAFVPILATMALIVLLSRRR